MVNNWFRNLRDRIVTLLVVILLGSPMIVFMVFVAWPWPGESVFGDMPEQAKHMADLGNRWGYFELHGPALDGQMLVRRFILNGRRGTFVQVGESWEDCP